MRKIGFILPGTLLKKERMKRRKNKLQNPRKEKKTEIDGSHQRRTEGRETGCIVGQDC